ncbi:MAG: ATP-binding protein [Acidobacteriaceae bacterium]|nr:ATP-binding protein [Acidobacteriaceae bacterium]
MKLFWRIFLFFWTATALMLALVLAVNELVPMTFPGEHERRFQPASMLPVLNAGVNAYEQKGESAFLAEARRLPLVDRPEIYLFDEHGDSLLDAGRDAPFAALMAQDVAKSDREEYVRLGFRVLYARPLASESGRRYEVVFTVFTPAGRLLNPRFWWNMAIAMLPASFVCLLLTFYLTRPITRLQFAAQRLASGDLNARAVPPGVRRRDELGDLAQDFDAMASRIQLLMMAQRRFVADVSHELGAPLTRMHLALALLRREYGDESSGIYRVERETQKLSSLVQQLLLLSSLEAGRVPSESLALISMRELCDSLLEDVKLESQHRACSIVGERQDVRLLVYPNLLRRAIENVLSNALRYSPLGGEIEFNCRVRLVEQEITIEVLDCGSGVPEGELTDIFRPFFRTAPGRESSSGGTGLGLAIASEAIQMHGGVIQARNRESGGLAVTITLPLSSPSQSGTYTSAS